jgi:hypothetical protein
MAEHSKAAFYLAAIFLAAFFVLRRRPKLAPDGEPPFTGPLNRILYLGHVIGLLWQRNAYYTNIRYGNPALERT